MPSFRGVLSSTTRTAIKPLLPTAHVQTLPARERTREPLIDDGPGEPGELAGQLEVGQSDREEVVDGADGNAETDGELLLGLGEVSVQLRSAISPLGKLVSLIDFKLDSPGQVLQ